MIALRPRDERGSIALFLLVSLVGLMLGALLVPMVVGAVRTTRFVSTRVQAIDVAQAGVDVAIGKIRAATDSAGLGDSSELPCAPTSTPLTGDVGAASYSVTIDYFTVDPVKNPTATPMLCVGGYGTYQPSTGVATPSFARMTSVGTMADAARGATRGRTLVSTYVIQVSNANVPGGTITLAGTGLCIDVGSSTPVAGTVPRLQACSTSTPPAAQQTIAYRNDLTLQVVSSQTAAYPDGLCLDTPAPPTNAKPVVLSACPASGVTPAYTQQWSNDDQGQFQASLPTSSTDGNLSDQCLGAPAATAGTSLQMVTCFAGGVYYSWIKGAKVGAGAAVAPQWVNYKEFSSCLDVTYRDVNQDHLIIYPCKQNPYAGTVLWNQKFTSPTIPAGASSATGVFVTNPGINYCLTSPGVLGGYVTTKLCVPGLATQQWTRYGGSNALTYSSRYTIVDSGGRCMGVGDPVRSETWSSAVLQTCDGGSGQKWNAPPNLTGSTVQNTTEK